MRPESHPNPSSASTSRRSRPQRRRTRPPGRSAPRTSERTDRPADRSDAVRLKVGDSAGLLAVVPYLLRTHPVDSIVVVMVRDGRVAVTARLDLPPPAELGAVAVEVGEIVRDQAADQVVLIVYHADAVRSRSVLAALGRQVDVPLGDAIHVDGERWWSTTCHQGCCPPGGRPYDVASHPVAAAAVYAGLTARQDANEATAMVVGPGAAESVALRRRLDELALELAELTARSALQLVEHLVGAGVGSRDPLGRDDLLRLVWLLRDKTRRDWAWAMIERPTAEDHLRLWAHVVAVAPRGQASAPVCLLGMAAWVAGDPELMRRCVDRIERINPTYTLGRLLADVRERAIPPHWWDELAAEARAEARAEFGVESST